MQLVPAQMNGGAPTPSFTPLMQSAVHGEDQSKSGYMSDFIKFSNDDSHLQKRARAESSLAEHQNVSVVDHLVDFTVTTKQHLKTEEDDSRIQIVANSEQ